MIPVLPIVVGALFGAAASKLVDDEKSYPHFRPHKITFAMRTQLDDPKEKRAHEATVTDLLEILTKHNVRFLTLHPGTPPLYRAGVRYEEEPPGEEDWCDIPTVIQQRWGDCEDLACWRAAELRMRGVPARAIFRSRKLRSGLTLYHIMVRLPNVAPFKGKPRQIVKPGVHMTMFPSGICVEDPSRVLGMGRKPSQYRHAA